MVNIILSPVTASVTELKKQPMETVRRGNGAVVAILNHNEPVFYCVPSARYAEMLEALEDAELSQIVRARDGQHLARLGGRGERGGSGQGQDQEGDAHG